MAHDPDTLEEKSATEESSAQAPTPPVEFTTGPSRAERAMPRTRRQLPLWPWFLIAAIIIGALAVYVGVT